MATKSYGFAIGNLRARENTLLKNTDMSQLAACKNTDDLTAALLDKGFGDRLRDKNISEILESSQKELWNYLRETTPDFNVFMPFIIKNDFHNLKAALKSVMRNIEPDRYFLSPVLCPTEKLTEAVKNNQFSILPKYLTAAAERAYSILISSGDVQICDAVIDAECMKAQLNVVNSRTYKCRLAREIITASVFYSNLKAAYRCAKAEKDGAFLDQSLIDTDQLSKSALKAAALGGTDKISTLLRSSGFSPAADAFDSSAYEFEKYCDNEIIKIAHKARYITLGTEPIIGYYEARKTEEKNIRIISSAVKTGQDEQKTLGRLRELYD